MSVPDNMFAIVAKEPGKADVLEWQNMRTPYPAEGQHLVQVLAAGINRPDILQRTGNYPPPSGLSDIQTKVLGLEVAGKIISAGRNTSRFKVGDHVCALVSGGGYSEYCIVDEATTLPIPENITPTEAAGIPETFFTVWHNVFERGALKSQEWLLVHGGSSGIGTTAIQLAKALGSKVIATVSSQEKKSFCNSLGAYHTINYLEENFVDVVKDITENHGVDVILDMIGGDYIEQNIKCAATEGRIVQIAFLNGSIAEVNFMRLMLKRLTITGSTLRSRSNAFKTKLAQTVEENVWPLLTAGQVKPMIDKTFAMQDAINAHKYMESRKNKGKIILVNQA